MGTIIFTLLSILISTSALIKINQYDDKGLTSCITKMVADIDYKKNSRLMDITLMNMNNDLQLSTIYQVEGARFISRRFYWDTDNISNVIYIVMSKDYLELANGLSKVISDKFWNPSAIFIIVVQNLREYSIHNVTDLLHTYNIFHKVSVISRDGDGYAIYKYNLTKPGYCLKAGHLKLWSQCSDYCSEKKIPPINIGSIRGCRYKFIARNLWPFTNFDTNLKGTEQFIISLFQKKYGVNIDLMEFTKVNKYGTPIDNATLIMIEKVENNKVEGVVGGYAIDSSNVGKNITHLYPMTIDYIRVVLARANFVDQWSAILSQSLITFIVISFLFVIFCLAAIFLSLFHSRNDVSRDILIIFGYLLNKTAVKRTASGWPQVCIFTTILFMAFLIPYAIQANLFSVTTRPVRGYEPKQFEDLKGYKPVLYSEWLRRKDFIDSYDCGTRIDCLLMVKNNPEKLFYTLISYLHLWIYQWWLADSHCNLAIYPLREPYMTIYRTIYLRRGSALMNPFNSFITEIASSGILKKHASDISYREQVKCKSHSSFSIYVPLKLSNFKYIFMILIGGYCLSLLIFIYEVWAGSQRKLKGDNHLPTKPIQSQWT
ncbi:uncharacterized protein LOC118275763 [Spodoptera frugiperda]|uniref:Uncharacterized protein LOC118275763 n=1 Tax=Spodoptera frugiperda TaxID=7108 RepID=A0A9R0DE96_SPOFR|nr:uncharacterized protein LOC118275763 [Spodoptera frugiperda]